MTSPLQRKTFIQFGRFIEENELRDNNGGYIGQNTYSYELDPWYALKEAFCKKKHMTMRFLDTSIENWKVML